MAEAVDADCLPAELRDALALAYGALDRDGDGKVDYHELIRTLKDTDTVRQARIY